MMATKRRWMKIPRTRLSETCPALMTQRSFKVHVAMWQVQVRGQGRRFTLAHSHWSGQLYVCRIVWVAERVGVYGTQAWFDLVPAAPAHQVVHQLVPAECVSGCNSSQNGCDRCRAALPRCTSM